jgi:hypothetical protein
MIRVFFVLVMASCWGHSYLNAAEREKPQEGQFAVQLAKRLHLATDPGTPQAIDLLTKASIIPRGGWQPAKPVGAELIVRTQVPISNLLFQVCRSLKVPAPPTLSQVVLNPPYAQQTIGYYANDIRESKETSQGDFAVKLAQKLKLAESPLSVKEAIALLSKIGITPKPVSIDKDQQPTPEEGRGSVQEPQQLSDETPVPPEMKDKHEGGWNSEAKATELFIVQIQIAILDVLKDVALQLSIPLPETMNIRAIVVD